MAQKFDSFFHKLRFKYKISILNENTLEESWNLHLSRLNVILFCFGIAVIYFFLIALLLIKTPFRTFLPGYYNSETLRKTVMKDALVLDSLETEVASTNKYLEMVKYIVAGDIKPDSLVSKDSLANAGPAVVNVNPSTREQKFNKKYEEQSKSQILDLSNSEDRPAFSFFLHQPASGVITQHFDPSVSQYGIAMNLRPNSNVCAALGGVVIASGYSREHRYSLHVQHRDNVITVYECTMPFLPRMGDEVRPGQAIALSSQHDACLFCFQIWEDGHPVNPESYLSF